jgi:biotin carboxylase
VTVTARRTPRLAVPFGRGVPAPLALLEAAEDLCDLVWLVDSSDDEIGGMLRILRRLGTVVDLAGTPPGEWADAIGGAGPDGIVAFSDTSMVAFAHAAAALGLPFHSPVTAVNLTDKAAQRAALRAGGLDVPASVTVPAGADPDEVARCARHVTFPAVLKPLHGNDSRLVTPIPDEGALLAAVAAGPAIPLLVEEYLTDTDPALGPGFANYLSVESVVSGGVVEHFAVTGRFPPAPPFRETGFFIPSTVDGADRDTVLGLAELAVRAVGAETGCLHTEIKLTASGWRVIEVNGRLGGGIPLMMDMAVGTSPIRMAMRVALGERADLTPFALGADIGFRMLFQAPMAATAVAAVDGLDEVNVVEGVRSVTLHRPPGSAVSWRTGNHDYVFSVAGVASDYDDLRRIERTVATTVTVTYR